MRHAKRLAPHAAALELNHQTVRFRPAPPPTHRYYRSRFTHASSATHTTSAKQMRCSHGYASSARLPCAISKLFERRVLSLHEQIAGSTGLQPAASCVRGRCASHPGFGRDAAELNVSPLWAIPARVTCPSRAKLLICQDPRSAMSLAHDMSG